MATNRDLAEAQACHRRRLVTAFVAGAPGGRELEPARPGRVVVGGLALAVLLVAGAAVAHVLGLRIDGEWTGRPGSIISKAPGFPVAITHPEDGAGPGSRPAVDITQDLAGRRAPVG